jgi:serine/threonine-protein kinase RsbT
MMMTQSKTSHLPIQNETDVVLIRQAVRKAAIEQGFSLIEQTKLVTAASEIARNTLEYGGGGEAILETREVDGRCGVIVRFIDHGPGIPDIELALKDGYTTGKGLGHGLGGAKRLVEVFEISSTLGVGTNILIARWK